MSVKLALELRQARMIRDHSNVPSMPYSVAEHSYFLALYCLIFQKDLDYLNDQMSNYKGIILPCININEYVCLALFHDIGEIWTGDIPYPMKRAIDSIALGVAEKTLVGYNVRDRLGNFSDFKEYMERYSDLSEMGFPVLFKLMDMYEYGVHKYHEFIKGDQTVKPILLNVKNYMNEMLLGIDYTQTFIDDFMEHLQGVLDE